MFDVSGKRILVTGGTSGIGLAAALRLTSAGARVIVCSRRNPGASLPEPLAYLPVDVSDEISVRALFEAVAKRFGRLDVLILNAGVSASDSATLAGQDVETFRDVIAVNTIGVLLGLKHASPIMEEGGSIIVTSSIAADTPFPGYMLYSSTKAALAPIVRHAAMQLGERRIRINLVSPGTVLTPMQAPDDPEARVSHLATCLRRAAQPEDLAGVFHFLAAQESGYITASEIRVDGGWIGGMTPALLEGLTGERG
jgi:3alpha(or 20beta)-hydroxysteroid dehydrogenase